MMRLITNDERRRRLGVRHCLSTPASSVVEAAGAMVGLHSSDPATVYLSARERVRCLTVARLDHALYEERLLLRMHGMRRTMFVVPASLAPLLDAGAAQGYLGSMISRIAKLAESQGVAADGAQWVRDLMEIAAETLVGRGPILAGDLTSIVPVLSTRLKVGNGEIAMTSRILYLLAVEGRVARGRPRGSWAASQYAWSLTEEWFGQRWEAMDTEKARAELLRRWLESYGPGTVRDLRWWTGWSNTHTRSALEALDIVEVRLEDGTGFVLSGDVGTTARPEPWAALLPGLDSTPMGWKDREWFGGTFPGPHYDRNGNIGPTVWLNGEVVGAWATGPDGEVRIQLDNPTYERDLIEDKRQALEDWLAGTNVTPRFRTPIEKTLSA